MSKSFLKNRCRYVRWPGVEFKLHSLALVGAQEQQMNTIFYLIFL